MSLRSLALSSLALVSFTFALGAAGCGSDVVEEDGGGSTGGAASGTGGAAAQAGGSAAGGAGEGGGVGAAAITAACSDACAEAPQCTNEGTPCTEFCANGAPEGCALEYAALVTCQAPHLGVNCLAPSGVCTSEREAFQACAATAPPTYCSGGNFSQNGASCEATGLCVNGQSARLSCSADAGSVTCQCFADEMLLGECADVDLICSWETTCCREFY